MFIDTHCHLNLMIDKESSKKISQSEINNIKQICKQANLVKVGKIINIGSSLQDSFDSVHIAKEIDCVWAVVGIHPYDCNENWKNDISQIKKRKVFRLRQEIGAVFQDYKLLSDRTIFENVLVPLLVVKAPKDERNERVEKALRLVGLGERMHLFPSQLSGGELQRAALARALVKKPKLIFADEPTGNLDDETAKGIFDLLSKINKEDITIIVTTHNNHFVKSLAKREIKLKNGKIVNK